MSPVHSPMSLYFYFPTNCQENVLSLLQQIIQIMSRLYDINFKIKYICDVLEISGLLEQSDCFNHSLNRFAQGNKALQHRGQRSRVNPLGRALCRHSYPRIDSHIKTQKTFQFHKNSLMLYFTLILHGCHGFLRTSHRYVKACELRQHRNLIPLITLLMWKNEYGRRFLLSAIGYCTISHHAHNGD